MKTLNIEYRGRGVFSAFVNRSFTTERGDTGTVFGAVRVKREGPNEFRIDRIESIGGAWLPWEPITDEVFATLEKAKDAICRWAKTNHVEGAPYA